MWDATHKLWIRLTPSSRGPCPARYEESLWSVSILWILPWQFDVHCPQHVHLQDVTLPIQQHHALLWVHNRPQSQLPTSQSLRTVFQQHAHRYSVRGQLKAKRHRISFCVSVPYFVHWTFTNFPFGSFQSLLVIQVPAHAHLPEPFQLSSFTLCHIVNVEGFPDTHITHDLQCPHHVLLHHLLHWWFRHVLLWWVPLPLLISCLIFSEIFLQATLVARLGRISSDLALRLRRQMLLYSDKTTRRSHAFLPVPTTAASIFRHAWHSEQPAVNPRVIISTFHIFIRYTLTICSTAMAVPSAFPSSVKNLIPWAHNVLRNPCGFQCERVLRTALRTSGSHRQCPPTRWIVPDRRILFVYMIFRPVRTPRETSERAKRPKYETVEKIKAALKARTGWAGAQWYPFETPRANKTLACFSCRMKCVYPHRVLTPYTNNCGTFHSARKISRSIRAMGSSLIWLWLLASSQLQIPSKPLPQWNTSHELTHANEWRSPEHRDLLGKCVTPAPAPGPPRANITVQKYMPEHCECAKKPKLRNYNTYHNPCSRY